jgi:6-phosphogluconolactonase
MTTREIRIVADAQALFRAAASEFARLAQTATRETGTFRVALAGGSTPKGLYDLLGDDAALREAIPWHSTHLYWGDERTVPPDHRDSNYRMAAAALLSRVPIPDANIHRMRGEMADADAAARCYEDELQSSFKLAPGQLPRFDLVLLGLGYDAHTASLFPHTAALDEQQRLAVANRVHILRTTRITLTAPVLRGAASVVFMVSGADKAQALRTVLEGRYAPAEAPAQLIMPDRGHLVWLVDRQAAGMLRNVPGD